MDLRETLFEILGYMLACSKSDDICSKIHTSVNKGEYEEAIKLREQLKVVLDERENHLTKMLKIQMAEAQRLEKEIEDKQD